MKIIINKCFGGFGLSKKAVDLYNKRSGLNLDSYDLMEYRTDKRLLSVVRNLGRKASGDCAELEIIEIPNNSYYHIVEYDGLESIYYSKSEIFCT